MSSDFPVGTIIGERYEIVRYIGKGGFATVYEARHLHMKRAVAVKILNAGFEGPESKIFEERFLLEATAAAQIEHANVVTIYDFGFTGTQRQPFIVMQLLRGRNLKDELVMNGPIAPTRVVPLYEKCLEALAQGHRQGIIHKDLKPANLFLSNAGNEEGERLCIVDFGVARIETADVSRLTSTGQILGTPKYLAPEYLRDQIVSPSLDVYQMGLILVEALTGRAVVDSPLPYTCILMHCTGELSIPAKLLDSPLGPILARAIHLDHHQRFANAGEFLTALRGLDATTVPHVGPDSDTMYFNEYTGPLAPVGRKVEPKTVLLPQTTGEQEVVPPEVAAKAVAERFVTDEEFASGDYGSYLPDDSGEYTGDHTGPYSDRAPSRLAIVGLAAAVLVLLFVAGVIFLIGSMGDPDPKEAQANEAVENVATIHEANEEAADEGDSLTDQDEEIAADEPPADDAADDETDDVAGAVAKAEAETDEAVGEDDEAPAVEEDNVVDAKPAAKGSTTRRPARVKRTPRTKPTRTKPAAAPTKPDPTPTPAATPTPTPTKVEKKPEKKKKENKMIIAP